MSSWDSSSSILWSSWMFCEGYTGGTVRVWSQGDWSEVQLTVCSWFFSCSLFIIQLRTSMRRRWGRTSRGQVNNDNTVVNLGTPTLFCRAWSLSSPSLLFIWSSSLFNMSRLPCSALRNQVHNLLLVSSVFLKHAL